MNAVYDQLDARASAVADRVIGWRRHLHQHPELSNREINTATLIADHLRSLGLDEVRTGIAGHGVVGVLRGAQHGQRVIALRTDTDALPVPDLCGGRFCFQCDRPAVSRRTVSVSHACGHDCHTAMLMGAAQVLAEVRESLPGIVLFVFQPAEEGPPVDEPGGAAEMLARGALDDPAPTIAFGFHVMPYPKHYIGYRVGNQFGASCLVKIVLTGQQVHGSTPLMGIDPIPAAGAILTGVGQLYRQVSAFDPVTVTIGHVEDVGRFNVISETVTLWGTIRCSLESDMSQMRTRLAGLAEHTAQAYNCTAEIEFLQDVPAVHNSAEWIEAALPTFRRVAGADKVVPSLPTLGYDDVSEFINKYGGLYVILDVQDSQLDRSTEMPVPIPGGRGIYMNHNPHFYADDNTLATGVRLHAHVAYDHLTGTLVPG